MSALSEQRSLRERANQLLEQLPGSALGWLERRRADALTAFEELGVPTRRDEDWRFTDLRSLEGLDLVPSTVPQPDSMPDRAIAWPAPALDAEHRIVLIDGVCSHRHSKLDRLPRGVRVRSLADALSETPTCVETLLGSVAENKQRAFTCLNTVLFADGALIELEAGAVLESPIYVICLQRGGTAPVVCHPRHLVSAGAGSRGAVVEFYSSLETGVSFENPVTEILLDHDAQLEHVAVQPERAQSIRLAALAVRQEAGSQFTSHSLALGGQLSRLDIRVELAGEGARAELRGLYLGRGSQHVDHHTTIDHAVPLTTSEEVYKGILDDRSHGVFHGRIHVRPDAQKIDAMQTNRNLLLSDAATLNTKPQLEIYADDVRCSHGATVGHLDADALFYLRARGLSEDEARSLLTAAFAREVIAKLPTEPLGAYADAVLLGWLGGGEPEGDRR